jgi:hypothetical protein
MEKNVGVFDRVIRFIIGLVALYLTFSQSLWWFILVVLMFVTSATGYCYLYKLLGISTHKSPSKPFTKSSKKKKR